MKTSKIFAVSLAAVLSFGIAMGSAHADPGVALQVKQLSAKQQNELLGAIAKARASNPVPFKRVAGVAAMVVKLDKAKRGRFAVLSPSLYAVGKAGVLPMLEMLAVKGPARGTMPASAWTALRVGLIEAVGMHRDPVAVPVLDAILDNESDYWVVRAAAEALGRIGSDASAQKLTYLATTAGPKQNAVLSALGDCRRTVAAQGLADFVKAPTDYETTRLALKSLGGVGNSWAWKTPALQKTGEEAAVRGTAVKALVDAFVRYGDKDLRLTAMKSILLVDDASTPALIEAARSGASADTRAALDKLADKFAHSPLHKY